METPEHGQSWHYWIKNEKTIKETRPGEGQSLCTSPYLTDSVHVFLDLVFEFWFSLVCNLWLSFFLSATDHTFGKELLIIHRVLSPVLCMFLFKKMGKIYLQFWNSKFYFLKESERKEKKKEKEGLAIKSRVKDPS